MVDYIKESKIETVVYYFNQHNIKKEDIISIEPIIKGSSVVYDVIFEVNSKVKYVKK